MNNIKRHATKNHGPTMSDVERAATLGFIVGLLLAMTVTVMLGGVA